jgi:hypothetical protein
MRTREVTEGQQPQGVDEKISYTLDVSENGSNPTNVTVQVYRVDGNELTDVKSTVMPTGTPTPSGNVITLPALQSLTDGEKYQIEVKYTLDNGNVLEDFFHVVCER